MKVLVCGGRHFSNYSVLSSILDDCLTKCNYGEEIEIVSGGCKGADSLAERYANENNIAMKIFPANWTKYGKAAGPIRNKEMVNYIKNYNSIVVAFISKDSIGTKNTVKLAKSNNIPTIEILYEVINETVELYEGIREATTNGYILDWNSDKPEDLVKLEGTCAHITKFNKYIRCYGYRVNKTPLNKNSRNKFLSYIKAESTPMRLELINRCIEDFYSKCNIKDFDYVIKTPSKSSLNNDIINELSKFDDFKLIDASKKPVEHLELDINEINSKFKKDYKENFIKYLQNIIDANKKSGKFSISTFKPQYRNFIKPMITFGDINIENNSSTNLLIIDDIFTSGSTINMILKLLRDIDFRGNIVILTLFQNS